MLVVGGCSGRAEVSDEGGGTFASIDEMASVSEAVVELEVTAVGEFRPLAEDEDGPSIYAYQLYETRVLDVLATTERAGLEDPTELTLGLLSANPEAALAELAEEIDSATPLRPGDTIVAFIGSLSDVGIPDAFTIVWSDQGRFDVDGEVAAYRGDGPMAGSTIRLDELRDALERSGALGTAADQDEPGSEPPTFRPARRSSPRGRLSPRGDGQVNAGEGTRWKRRTALPATDRTRRVHPIGVELSACRASRCTYRTISTPRSRHTVSPPPSCCRRPSAQSSAAVERSMPSTSTSRFVGPRSESPPRLTGGGPRSWWTASTGGRGHERVDDDRPRLRRGLVAGQPR